MVIILRKKSYHSYVNFDRKYICFFTFQLLELDPPQLAIGFLAAFLVKNLGMEKLFTLENNILFLQDSFASELKKVVFCTENITHEEGEKKIQY